MLLRVVGAVGQILEVCVSLLTKYQLFINFGFTCRMRQLISMMGKISTLLNAITKTPFVKKGGRMSTQICLFMHFTTLEEYTRIGI